MDRSSDTKLACRLGRALSDRYRCPENFVDFVLSEPSSPTKGFFRLGPKTICYGRSSSGPIGSRPQSALYDVIGDVRIDDGRLHLPFDPTEIIDNLCLESYVGSPGLVGAFERFLRKLYYRFRPVMNLTARTQIQKLRARNWKKQSFPKWPVDTTVEDISETLLLMSMKAAGLQSIPFVWFWPDGATGCVAMTHDVETTAGRDFCAELMNVDDSFGIKSAFGVVPEGRYEVTSNFINSVRGRGFEVLIHDLNHDGRLFDNKEEFLRRATTINRYGSEFGAKGFRAAVLYRNPAWYEALEFAFDTSIPNVARLDPQRGGCCTVMPYFIRNVVEIPVTAIQDYTLFHILEERSIDLWKKQVDIILGKKGLVNFIVHPDYLLQSDTLSVYKNLLGHLRELAEKKPIWFALPSEINRWWRERSKMSVVKNGSSWRIEGDAANRAKLAYAKNVGGKLVYELGESSEVELPNQE